MSWPNFFFLPTRWRLVPLAWPCFEAPSPAEADLLPAMTVSWRLAEPERPSPRQDELRASRIVRLALVAMLWSGLARWIWVEFPGKNVRRRRRPVSVYPGSSAVWTRAAGLRSGREKLCFAAGVQVTQSGSGPASYVSLGGGKRPGGVRWKSSKVQRLRPQRFNPPQQASN